MKRLPLIAISLAIIFTLENCARTRYEIDSNDARAIDDIMTRGVGQHFVVPSLQPHKDGRRATYRFIEVPMGVMIKAPYGGEVKIGNGSPLHFIGTISLGDTIFVSDDNNPLVFVVLENIGLVYIRGKGKVISGDGKEVVLP